MKNPVCFKILNTLSLTILSVFFVNSTLAANPCTDLNKKIRFAQSTAKNTQEYIAELKGLASNINNHADGIAMKTVRVVIWSSFLTSPTEVKENVEKFFNDRLHVNENIPFPQFRFTYTQMKASTPNELESAIAILEGENTKHTESIESASARLKKNNTQSITNETNEILKEVTSPKSEDNVKKYGEIALSVSDTEVNLATNKAQLKRNELYLKALLDLQLQAKTFCSTTAHLGSLTNVAIELSDAETQSVF